MERRFIWLLVLVTVPGGLGWMKERPVLESVDGHLVIWGAENKNVTIKTKGGYLTVNDIDLVNAATAAHKAAGYIDSWRAGTWRDIQERVDRLARTVDGPDGLRRKFELLSWKEDYSNHSSGHSGGQYDDGSLQSLSSRVSELETKVRKILSKLKENKCSSNPCQNGGTCIRIYNGFQCICPPNWQGDSCQTDVNECAIYVGTDLGCQNGATCINTIGSYTCSCATGWYGIHCISRTSACNSADSRELCGYGVCVDQKGTPLGYACICDQGWKAEGANPACVMDVDECASKQAVCSVNPRVECINLPGTYHCGNCPPGYTGNGHSCDDINECLEDNGGCSMNPKVKCFNIPGSRICAPCPSGYSGNGETCIQAGLCSINNGGCHPLATCVTGSSPLVQCRCPVGYTGDGMGPTGCSLSTGVTTNACSSNPCVNGVCVPVGQTFTCRCNPGFTGPLCLLAADPCSPNPCKNSGSCSKTGDGGFSCECTAAFKGTKCETPKNTCGGYLRDAAGNLAYPPVDGGPIAGIKSCAFVFATSPDKVLNVTFTRFKVPSSTSCVTDFIQLHDGRSTADHLIGRFCGNKAPRGGNIVTTHNHLYMWVSLSGSDPQEGFSLHWNSIEPSCGGYLTGDYGTISSPGTPGKYPLNRNCTWEIDVNPGRRILFHFFTMQLEEHGNCHEKDYLQINETIGERDIQLGIYCGHVVPGPLYTSGPYALLYFHSDGDTQDQGFQVAYSTVEASPGCGGVVTGPKGTVSSPTVKGEYEAFQNCVWKIQLPKGERIRLIWQDMDIESNRNCYFDSVKVYEGPNEYSPLVGTYCGETLPLPRTLSTNIAIIVFTTDSSSQGRGFTLKYDTYCGGEFREPSGIITSPYYPHNYPAEADCHYEIVQPPEKSILLNVLDLDIEGHSHSGCYFDYLRIYDGDNENATQLAELCGGNNKIPDDAYYSTHNHMYLFFQTDGSNSFRGFKANYSTVDRRCGGLYKEPTGSIQSPTDGDSYSNNENCTWTIQAPPGHVIELTWVSFDLETHYKCMHDWVEITEIYDGGEITAMKVCGHSLPSNFYSMGRVMNIYFHSDESVTSDGFLATYKFMDTSKSCGGRYLTPVGTFESPGYPDRYPNDKECAWVIEAEPREQIWLEIEEFELESSTDCTYDYLEIRNGAHSTSPLIGRYCGNKSTTPGSLLSFTNHLYLKFVSDGSKTKKGFRVSWFSALGTCGGTLTSSTGDIMSPNYPVGYAPFSFCTWNIAINAGNKLQIILVDVDFKSEGECQGDYLEVSEGRNGRARNTQRICRADTPGALEIPSNTATVQFRSSFGNGGHGFHLRYRTICSGKLRGFTGVIESPNFPNNYPPNTNCSWIIEAPIGNKINIAFSHFDLEPGREWKEEDKCGYDYLKIQEGEDDKPVTDLGTFCPLEGMQMPPKITTTMNQLFINFVTDRSMHYGGFRLEWIVHGCGGYIRKANGQITSPGYPNPYPTSIICEWVIEVEYGHSVQINFIEVETEKVGGCDIDKIQIYGGENDEAPELGELCHTDQPRQYISPINKMMIRLHSDWSHSGKGFLANFTTVNSVCGGTFNAPHGYIHSQNYPMNYPPKQNCEWLLQTDTHHVLNLTFLDVDIEGSRECKMDYIKVFDGPTREHKELVHFCSHEKPLPIISSGDELLVVMYSDAADVGKGFRAEVQRACGARIVTNDTGTLTTAADLHLMHSYEGHNCSWIIVAENPGDHITLRIPYMDLSCNYGDCDELCSEHALEIYEGEGLDGPRIGQWCGMKVPPEIVSTGNALTIHLATYSYSDVSFVARYSALDSACGGYYYAESATLASPGYPNSYPPNIECEWKIEVAPGNQILLDFSSFDLQADPNCDLDYLEIREQSPAGKLLTIFCGNNATTITSTQSIWMKFKSDETGTATGFEMEYTLTHGSELNGTSGVIASPMYPRPFTKAEDINWRIIVEVGFSVKIEFDDFHIDSYAEGECEYWYEGLKFYDGYDEDAPLLHAFCGFQKPEPFQSSSNVMYITFSGDKRRLGNWFKLRYYQVPRESNNDANEVIDLSECNQEIALTAPDNKSVSIASPGYPHGYNHSLNCNWVFTSPAGTHLFVSFLDINLEESDGCVSDRVALYDGMVLERDPPDSNLIGQYCTMNQSHLTAQSSTNTMTLKFVTDSFINRTGFEANVRRICGGQLTEPNGIIEFNDTVVTSERIWRNWQRECEWNVTVRRGRTIEVTILNIDLPDKSDTTCADHYIFLRNGHERDAPFLGDGKYCRQELLETLMTTGNKLNVRMSARGTRGKYKLSYREVSMDCGEVIELIDGMKQKQLTTPRYKNPPPPYTECTWKILAPTGHRVSLHFIDRFDLTDSTDCQKEFVEVRDGGTDGSQLIGSYCGSKPPSTLVSTGNMMYVHYYTENETPADGFKAMATNDDICGGILRETSGIITSPNYPGTYPKGQECYWWIQGLQYHSLKIEFTDLSFPICYRDCNNTDSVHVFDKLPNNESLLEPRDFHGRKVPTVFNTLANEAIVVFHSEHSTVGNYRGFRLKFTSTRNTCGGQIEGLSGTLKSTGYPSARNSGIYCKWMITVPPGNHIKINIEDFDTDFTTVHQDQVRFYNEFRFKSRIPYDVAANYQREVLSSSNQMMIIVIAVKGYRGISATYEAIPGAPCGDKFEDVNGTLSIPSVLPYSERSFYCEWKLDAPQYMVESGSQESGVTLALTVTGSLGSFRKETQHCTQKSMFLRVFAGTDDIGEVCGDLTGSPMVIRSPLASNKVSIMNGTALTQAIQQRMNIGVIFQWSKCGGTLTGPEHTLKTPQDVQLPVNCVWKVEYASGQAITMRFSKINLGDCDQSYILVKNGGPKSPVIGKWCGNILPNNITSKSNKFWIEYYAIAEPREFELDLSAENSRCASSGNVITSPDYPSQYPNSSECEWEFSAQPGYHFGISFVDRFNLETSENCTKDFVEVFDKNYTSWVSLGRVCGRNIPKPFNTTSNHVKIVFRANEAIRGDGFKAIIDKNCGGVLKATTNIQKILSPDFSSLIEATFCNYTIVPPTGATAIIEFEMFELSKSKINTCSWGNLTITTENSWQKNTEMYCGTSKPPVQTSTRPATIVLKAKTIANGRGFIFRYMSSECGGEIDKPGTLIPPTTLDDSTYHHGLNCTWVITAPSDKAITLRFEEFDLEYSYRCFYDFVKVYEGKFINESTIIATHCGHQADNLPTVKSVGNSMTVLFRSDGSESKRGFRAIILFNKNEASGCGGRINVTGDMQWNFPRSSSYENFEDCMWSINAAPYNIIKLKFLRLDLKSTPNRTTTSDTAPCSGDFLEVRDGRGPSSELIGRYCGSDIPAPIHSTRNSMWMRFYADGEVTGSGISAEFSVAPSICGNTLVRVTNETVLLNSPRYPDNYYMGIKCKWTLEADSGRDLHIHLKNIDMEDLGDCSGDHLRITDRRVNKHLDEGFGENYIITGENHNVRAYPTAMEFNPMTALTFCGKVESYDYYTGGNIVDIALISTNENPSKPRKFEVEVSIADCKKNYTQPQGRIYHQGAKDCATTITVAENHTISLYFLSFNMMDRRTCSDRYLKIYDGNFDGNLVGTYCGPNLPPPVFSTSNILSLSSKTRDAGVWEGYDLIYTSTDQGRGCGGSLFNYAGIFTSPMHPNTFRNDSTCTWDVNVPRGSKVLLKFPIFDVGLSETCDPHLTIRDGSGVNVETITYCGGETPANYKSSSNSVQIVYESTVNNGGTGWIITFTAVEEDYDETRASRMMPYYYHMSSQDAMPRPIP